GRCKAGVAWVVRGNAETMFGADGCRDAGHRAGSTDMGDVSQVMPVLHPYMGGARGTGHAADYAIVDPRMAYVMPARALAAMVVDLLWDGAGRAREVVATAEAGAHPRRIREVPARHPPARGLRRHDEHGHRITTTVRAVR